MATFQYDNVPQSRLFNWFHEHDSEFSVIQWPPIEHLWMWGMVEWEICSMNMQLTDNHGPESQRIHEAVFVGRS